MELGGIHHVTAVTGNAPGNVDFYTRVLGMRLVKKTVNQDVINTYHLFYGDQQGHAGTEMTFFDWPNAGTHRPGVGDISAVSFVVPDRAALDWWVQRFDAMGVRHSPVEDRNGRAVLPFLDPDGQRLELVEGPKAGTTPWRDSDVPAEAATQGLGPVTLAVENIRPTSQVLTDLLGFKQTGEYSFADNPSRRAVIFQVGEGGPGAEVHLEERPEQPGARVGVGGVHHVAFRTPDDREHEAWQRYLTQAGVPVTPVIDRFYFRSIYFREPGGVLFEIATDGPGFGADEDIEHLGERLSLPPFLESKRAQIEAQLRPLEPAGSR